MGSGSSVLGFVVLVVCVVVAAIALRKKQNVSAVWPVYARPVMSEVERQLFRRLIEAFPEKVVLPQVQLCRFVEVRDVLGRMAVLNRYNRLSADFVICNADAAVERVVELDDRSHHREAARSRDAKKDAVLNAAGIPVVRLQARAIPSVGDLPRLVFGEQHASGMARAQQHGSKVEPTISIP
jgi:hypothetical protein